ncbi:MAG: aminoglycoside phosphotransferase family protein, partial [bacterium]|nr:aminoglycoside phosphotransferase family protein [Candidatus Kapabacteria bacterium]
GKGGYAFIVMERLAGEPWITIRENGTAAEQVHAVEQMARAVRAIHTVDVSTLSHYRSDRQEWVAKMRARAELAPMYLAEDLPEQLAREIKPFLDANLEAITDDYEPLLISTDVNSFNSLFIRHNDNVTLSGQIDFGDMEVGPLEYEWPSVVQKALRHNESLAAAFFAAYGPILPFSGEQLRRLKVYSLLHRFPTVQSFAERNPEVASLERLLDMQWDCVTDRSNDQSPAR